MLFNGIAARLQLFIPPPLMQRDSVELPTYAVVQVACGHQR